MPGASRRTSSGYGYCAACRRKSERLCSISRFSTGSMLAWWTPYGATKRPRLANRRNKVGASGCSRSSLRECPTPSARRRRGRPITPREVADLVVRMAVENPPWGYTRIRGALANLGHDIARNTVKRILHDHGIEPAPERARRTPWTTIRRARSKAARRPLQDLARLSSITFQNVTSPGDKPKPGLTDAAMLLQQPRVGERRSARLRAGRAC